MLVETRFLAANENRQNVRKMCVPVCYQRKIENRKIAICCWRSQCADKHNILPDFRLRLGSAVMRQTSNDDQWKWRICEFLSISTFELWLFLAPSVKWCDETDPSKCVNEQSEFIEFKNEYAMLCTWNRLGFDQIANHLMSWESNDPSWMPII